MTKAMLSTLFLLFITSAASAQLIKPNEIFVSEQFNSFVIAPDGKTLIGKSFLDGSQQLFAFKADSKSASEIFKIARTDNMQIIDFDWLDSNTAYVTYLGPLKSIYTRFIDFEFEKDDFDIDYFDVYGAGYIVNPMSDKEDKALFAKLNIKERKFELLELNVAKLRKVKHNSKNHKKVIKTFTNLSKDLDNTFNFFVSNKDYKLNMVGQRFDDYTSYSIYDEKTQSWQEFFKLKKNTNKEKNHSKLDVFKPIAKIADHKIIALSNIGRDKVAVVTYDTIKKQNIDVLYKSDNYDIKSANYNTRHNKLISVSYTERGVNKQKFLDKVEQGKQLELPSSIGLDSIFIVDRSLENSDKIIYAYDATHPGKYYHYNEKTGKLRFLQNAIPDLHPYTFTKAKLLTARNELDKLVEGFLYIPQENNKNPMVVMPHGGPIGVQDFNDFEREIQFLVNRGYAVLTINFRGSAGYGKEYMNAGREQFGEGIEADINLITNKALSLPQIDKSNVCIYGNSYGGYSAVTSTMLYPEVYQCAISAFGVFDLPLLYSATNLHHSQSEKDAIAFIVGDIDTNYLKLKNNSPVYKAQDIKVPTLIFSGAQDEVAHPEHSRRLNYVLREIDNTEVEYHEYIRASHGHDHWEGDIHQYLTLVEFLDKHIGKDKKYSDQDKSVIANDYYLLGKLYNDGYFIKKDLEEAKHYFRLAHNYGDDRAAQYLRRLGVYNF